jgi:hypothetical protein
MEERRQHDRHSTELQLEVFDLHSGRRLGRVVDLSAEGFMLFSDTLQTADTLVECRLVSEQVIEGVCEITLGADCLWSRPGSDDIHCWAGFHIIDLAEDQAAALEVLLKHL